MTVRSSFVKYGAALAVMASLAVAAPRAQAAVEEVGSWGKGIVGLGMLGGELVLSIEALAGVKHPAALAVPTIVVAAGGAVGGYFLDAWGEKENKPEASVAMLACGMALFIPAIVITVAKLKFVGDKDLAEDVEVTVKAGGVAEGGAAAGTVEEGGGEGEGGSVGTEVETTEEQPAEGASLGSGVVKAMIEVSPGSIRIGVPPLEMVSLYSQKELMAFAAQQGVEYRLGLVNVAF